MSRVKSVKQPYHNTQTGGFYRLFSLDGADVPATTQNAYSAKLKPLARGNDG